MHCTFLRDPQTGRPIATICGPQRISTCALCGMPSGFLCDFPLGRKRTCDKNICQQCAITIAPNVQFCPDHPLPATQLTLELTSCS